jgi:hypothetical protein
MVVGSEPKKCGSLHIEKMELTFPPITTAYNLVHVLQQHVTRTFRALFLHAVEIVSSCHSTCSRDLFELSFDILSRLFLLYSMSDGSYLHCTWNENFKRESWFRMLSTTLLSFLFDLVASCYSLLSLLLPRLQEKRTLFLLLFICSNFFNRIFNNNMVKSQQFFDTRTNFEIKYLHLSHWSRDVHRGWKLTAAAPRR